MDIIETKKVEELFRAILDLSSEKEAKMFFRDLLTESELEEFSNRWKAAQMLDQKISYLEIQKETGLSSTTVARISKWLNNGRGGYKLMLNKIKHHSKTSSSAKGLS